MLIRIFNKVYQFILGNKILKFGFYLALIAFPFIYILLLKYKGVHFSETINLSIPIYLILIIEILHRIKIIPTSISDNIKYLAKIYFIIELLLVVIKPSNIYDQYFLDNYLLTLTTNQSGYYNIKKPSENYHLKTKEFDFERKANSIGLSDKEIDNKNSNKIRILCFGDSFTEGDGASQDSSYVRFLDRSLHKKYQNLEIINAGRCGSDPFFDFKLLQDILIQYQPDIILQSFTTNDLSFDMVMRGGNKRFKNDKTLSYQNIHWWTPIYAVSYSARIIIQTIGGYDKYLINQKDYPHIIEKMKMESTQLFEEYQKFTKEKNIDLIVFTLPFKSDFNGTENKDFHLEMKRNFSKFNLNFYNLQPCYEDEIKTKHTKFQDYYWKIDGHHNAKGYEMMAKCLEKIVIPIIEKRSK